MALLFIAIVPLISLSEQIGMYCSLIINSSESHLATHNFSQSQPGAVIDTSRHARGINSVSERCPD